MELSVFLQEFCIDNKNNDFTPFCTLYYNLYVTFLLNFLFCFFFSIDFYNFYRIMSRSEEYLRDFFWNIFWCLLLCWLKLFLSLTNPANFSVIWCCSVALDLCRIQFSDLAKKSGWLTTVWNAGCKQSNLMKRMTHDWLFVCFLADLSLTFFIIYLFRTP